MSWTINMFPMGAFWANSADGRFAVGRCDPITKEILEWREMKEEDGSSFEKYDLNQTCSFCENPESILTPLTCCTGCSKLKLTSM
jgi:hypothetical protein